MIFSNQMLISNCDKVNVPENSIYVLLSSIHAHSTRTPPSHTPLRMHMHIQNTYTESLNKLVHVFAPIFKYMSVFSNFSCFVEYFKGLTNSS